MKKIHKYIILGLLCLFASLEAFAQEVLISGVVKDKNDNQPLPYVSVVVRDKRWLSAIRKRVGRL